jgi:hypothetical protein
MALAAIALASLLSLGGDASAQATGGTTYDVVSSYQMSNSAYTYVTGVVHGQTATTTTTFVLNTGVRDQCERMLLVMVNRPGRFQLTFDAVNTFHCTLTAVP